MFGTDFEPTMGLVTSQLSKDVFGVSWSDLALGTNKGSSNTTAIILIILVMIIILSLIISSSSSRTTTAAMLIELRTERHS